MTNTTESLYSERTDDDFDVDRIESEDIPEQPAPFYMELLKRMNPQVCLTAECGTGIYKTCLADEVEEFEWLLPGLLRDIQAGKRTRTAALQKLFRLVDKEHKDNRKPAVCSTKFETIKTLVTCLDTATTGNANDRRQALLILNNLCIPTGNKNAILFGDSVEDLLTALCNVIRARLNESYLSIAVLTNLSSFQDDHAKVMLLNFVVSSAPKETAPETYKLKLPIDDPDSLLRILEAWLTDYAPYSQQESVEQQGCRWAVNVMRNLVTVDENAISVAKTSIPAIAVQFLTIAKLDLKKWTRDSLEDASLMLLVHLGKLDTCLELLTPNESLVQATIEALEKIQETEGIHQKRAEALVERLEEARSTRSVGYSV